MTAHVAITFDAALATYTKHHAAYCRAIFAEDIDLAREMAGVVDDSRKLLWSIHKAEIKLATVGNLKELHHS